jgi:hypothetical protein
VVGWDLQEKWETIPGCERGFSINEVYFFKS